jgi:hypothetical protein
VRERNTTWCRDYRASSRLSASDADSHLRRKSDALLIHLNVTVGPRPPGAVLQGEAFG